MTVKLKDRDKEILNLLVEEYIRTSEPVASKTIVEQYGINWSSATVRNVMKFLEDGDFLYQPHTSAGRIPSDRGYRAYVDSLLSDMSEASAAISLEYLKYLDSGSDSENSLIDRAAEILQKETGYFVISVATAKNDVMLNKIRIFRLDNNRLLLLLIFSDGNYKDLVIRLDADYQESLYQEIGDFLERHFAGMLIRNIKLQDIRKSLFAAFANFLVADVLNIVAYSIFSIIYSYKLKPWHYQGENSLYNYPELGSGKEISDLIAQIKSDCPFMPPTVENRLRFDDRDNGRLYISAEAMPWKNSDYPFVVRIGEELYVEYMKSCSLISSYFEDDNEHFAYLTVIGPKRMNYKKVFDCLDQLRRGINELLRRRRENYTIEI